jgi:hypothetical protein
MKNINKTRLVYGVGVNDAAQQTDPRIAKALSARYLKEGVKND